MDSCFRRKLVAVVVASAFSATAFAGFKTGQQVVISDANRFANGDMGYVRNTADSTQFIGCEITGNSGYCYARNRDGLTRQCSTTESKWLNTIRAVNGDTYLYFAWGTDGKCTSVSADNSSTPAPK